MPRYTSQTTKQNKKVNGLTLDSLKAFESLSINDKKQCDPRRPNYTKNTKQTKHYTEDNDAYEELLAPSENTTNISLDNEKRPFWSYDSLRKLATQGFFFTLWHTMTLATDRGLACWVHFTDVDRLVEPWQRIYDGAHTISISYVWIIGSRGTWHWADDAEISLAHARYPLASELFPFASGLYKKHLWELRTFEDLVPEGCNFGDRFAYLSEFISAKNMECDATQECSYHVAIEQNTKENDEHSWACFDEMQDEANHDLKISGHFMTRHNIGYYTQSPDGPDNKILDYQLYNQHNGENAINHYWTNNDSRMTSSRARFLLRKQLYSGYRGQFLKKFL